jgi:hypothetical protein
MGVEGKIVKIWHVLWHFRTWGRMPQGRTGTGCPSYEEEIEEAASSSSVFCLEFFCLLLKLETDNLNLF